MKHLFSLCLVIIPFLSMSQKAYNPAGTTEQEYLYVTNGYSEDVLKKGYDLKQGYFLGEIYNGSNVSGVFDKHRISIKALYNLDTSFRAAIVIVYTNDVPVKVLCLPNYKASEEMKLRYGNSVSQLTAFQQNILAQAFSFSYATLFDAYENKKPR